MKTACSAKLWRTFVIPCLSLIGLSIVFAAEPSRKPAEPVNTAKIPSAEDVIARFVKAMGGKEAFSKIESQRATGKVEMQSQGISGSLEVFGKRPNQLLVKTELPVLGKSSEGFDGKIGWSLNAVTGPMLTEGKQLEQARQQADFDAVLHDRKDYKSMENLGTNHFEGRPCFKLKLVRKSGDETTEFYDIESGLLIGWAGTVESPLGAVTTTNLLGEYKKFGDILLATKTTQTLLSVKVVMVLDHFEFNKVPDSVFELPPEIKALIKPVPGTEKKVP